MRQNLKATAVDFSQEDLESMIPADTINRIKLEDAEPIFKAYVVAHEGEINATMHGEGRKTLQYAGEGVQKVYEALRYGLPAFYRHEGNDGTGNNTGREAIGELVGMSMRPVDDKLQAIAAFYIMPGSHRSKDLRAASIEASVECFMDGDEVRVKRVDAVTGIALSDIDEPAFEGATLLATMQAFSEAPEEVDMTDPRNNPHIAKVELPMSVEQAYKAACLDPVEREQQRMIEENPLIAKVELPMSLRRAHREACLDPHEKEQQRIREENPLIP